MSAAVVPRPRENRTICRDAALSGFIARTTWEGSSEAARQARQAEADGAGGGADAGLVEK